MSAVNLDLACMAKLITGKFFCIQPCVVWQSPFLACIWMQLFFLYLQRRHRQDFLCAADVERQIFNNILYTKNMHKAVADLQMQMMSSACLLLWVSVHEFARGPVHPSLPAAVFVLQSVLK